MHNSSQERGSGLDKTAELDMSGKRWKLSLGAKLMPGLMKKKMFHCSNICCAKQKDKFLLPGGVGLQLRRTDPQMYFSKKEFRRPGWGLLTVAPATTNCPGIQSREGGSQWSNVREETGGGKRKCWTTRSWSGNQFGKVYGKARHTESSSTQSSAQPKASFVFSSRTRMTGWRPAPAIHTGSHR